MKTIHFEKQGLFQRCLKPVLGGGIIACLCMAAPAWASLIPLPMVCIDGGTPIVTTSDLDEIIVPGSTPVITYGLDQAEIQFYVLPVFIPIIGQRSVILTVSGTPSEYVTLSVTQLIGQNSVDIFAETSDSPNFAANIALLGSSTPTLPETGANQNLSASLNVGENLLIGVNCSSDSVPDSTSTLALLGLSMAGVLLLRRQTAYLG